MGIFNQQPNYNQSYTIGKRGPQGPPGPAGPAGAQGIQGVGFKLTGNGDYDINGKKMTNIVDGTGDKDVVSKKWIETHVSTNAPDLSPYLKKDGTVSMTGNLDLNDNKIIGVEKGTDDTDAVNKKQMYDSCLITDGNGNYNANGKKIWNLNQNFSQSNVVPDMGEIWRITPYGTRDGNLGFDFKGKKLYNISVDNNDSNIPNNKWISDRYLKLAGGTMTGNLNMNNQRIYNLPIPTGDQQPTPKKWIEDNYLNKSTGVMAGPLNMSNNKITHLATPTNSNDCVNKSYVDTKLATKANSITSQNYVKKDGTVAMTGDLNLNNNKIINVSDPQSDKDSATRGWVRKQIARFDHHSGDGEINIFKKINPITVTTIYLQCVSGHSFDDFTFTTSAPGQPLTAWTPTANTFINKIEFQFSKKANINVDFLWFTARDSRISDSAFWVSAVKSGTWTLNINKSFSYDMSGVHL